MLAKRHEEEIPGTPCQSGIGSLDVSRVQLRWVSVPPAPRPLAGSGDARLDPHCPSGTGTPDLP